MKKDINHEMNDELSPEDLAQLKGGVILSTDD